MRDLRTQMPVGVGIVSIIFFPILTTVEAV
jgi:hypothetical protein